LLFEAVQVYKKCIIFQVEGAAGRIARADVARFMLSVLGEEKYHKKQLAIAV